MKKKVRNRLYHKYNGHCAYCGCKLQSGWHADHLIPIRRNVDLHGNLLGLENPENDTEENLMPSCPSCNINKHSGSIEDFRNLVSNFVDSLNKQSVQYKVAKRYGQIKETRTQIVFYFEKLNPKS